MSKTNAQFLHILYNIINSNICEIRFEIRHTIQKGMELKVGVNLVCEQ